MATITLTSFALTISGLKLTYTVDGQKTVRTFDPHATCDFLQGFDLIEGFDQDRNGEPVILFTDNVCGVPQTGYALWFRFVEGYEVSRRMAEIFVDRIEMTRAFAKTQATITRLMKPLQAA